MPKISVIVPVYNVEQYLEECLDSITNQTLQDIEVICINDGSSDNSLNILEKFIQKDPRISIINQTNSGTAIARNNGINLAKGDYLTFVDADDYIDKNYLETLFKASKNNSFDIIATAKVKLVFPNSQYKRKNVGLEEKEYIINSKKDRAKIFKTTGVTCNKIYKTSFVKQNKIYFPNVNCTGEDNYFTILSTILANKIKVVGSATYYYRQNEVSQTQKVKSDKHFKILDIYKQTLETISELKMNSLKKRFWLKETLKRAQIDILLHYNEMKKVHRKEFRKLIQNTFPEIKIKEPISNLIVSLTSYTKRIHIVHETIDSIYKQSIEPEKIILTLAIEEFPNKEKDLPKSILKFQERGLEIIWCKNIKSYKKLIPTLERYPNYIIVTADDDVTYDHFWLEKLYKSYLKNPNMVHCKRAHRIVFSKNRLKSYKNWAYDIVKVKPSYNNFFTGIGGVLYPPNIFYKDVSNEKLFTKLCSDTDDIWFWAMCILNKVKINVIENNDKIKLNEISGSQKEGLWQKNVLENNNDINMQKITDYYPEIINLLSKNFFIRPISFYLLCMKILTLFNKDFIYKYKLKSHLVKIKNKTILWGASLFLEDVIKKYNINNPNIIGIIDKNPNRQGGSILSYKIYSPEDMKTLNPQETLLTVKNYHNDIFCELEEYFKQNYPEIKLLPNIFE